MSFRSRVRFASGLATSLFVLAGCGGGLLSGGGSSSTLAQPGEGSRDVITMSDLERIHDVVRANGKVYVGTDDGLYVFPGTGDAESRRLGASEGLGGDEVTAVAALPDGRVMVATGRTISILSGDEPSGETVPSGLSRVNDLLVRTDDVLGCGPEGLVSINAARTVRIGEDAACRALYPAGDHRVVAALTEGMLVLEGDVVREHSLTSGVPTGVVRGALPLGDDLLVLAVGESARLGLFDGDRWFVYTVPELEQRAAALLPGPKGPLLVTDRQAFEIGTSDTDGSVPLVALTMGDPNSVRAYRARERDVKKFPAAELVASVAPYEPKSFVEMPAEPAELEAPDLYIRSSNTAMPDDAYAAFGAGEYIYIADNNRGAIEISAGGKRLLRTRSLVAKDDLAIATDANGATWILTDRGRIAQYRGTGFQRVPVDAGLAPMAIASTESSAFVLARTDAETPTLKLFELTPERRLQEKSTWELTELGVPLADVPFMAFAADGSLWAGVKVIPEEDAEPRMRGVMVLAPDGGPVVYHHHGAVRDEGSSAIPMPDHVSGIEIARDGMIWFPSINGAVRVGDAQAVAFGEARGVRGELVSDIAVTDTDRMWLAAGEGLGYYENGNFEFNLPAVAKEARPIALAVDNKGGLWAVGPNGALYGSGSSFEQIGKEQGLPSEDLRDVEVDRLGRIWFLASDAVVLFSR